MSEYLVEVERDSVCMGDDIDAPHSYNFSVSANANLKDIFDHLAGRQYLASVNGKNHSWDVMVGGRLLAIIKGNNQVPEATIALSHAVKEYISQGKVNVYFKYKSSVM